MQCSHSNSSTSTSQQEIRTPVLWDSCFLGEGLILIAAQQTCSDNGDPAQEPSQSPQELEAQTLSQLQFHQYFQRNKD